MKPWTINSAFALHLRDQIKMKYLALILALCATTHAAPPDSFWRALHIVETSGRTGPIVGDGGAALGPLQIHRAYHKDSRVPGEYERVADLAYSKRVASAYLRRYAPEAWAKGDIVTLARVHNGGPRGASKTATLGYGRRVAALASKK
jgi:hypothetical protein